MCGIPMPVKAFRVTVPVSGFCVTVCGHAMPVSTFRVTIFATAVPVGAFCVIAGWKHCALQHIRPHRVSNHYAYPRISRRGVWNRSFISASRLTVSRMAMCVTAFGITVCENAMHVTACRVTVLRDTVPVSVCRVTVLDTSHARHRISCQTVRKML